MIALLSAAYAATHVDGAVVVRVDDREKAVATVVQTAEAAGGWFSSLSDASVTIQVPVEKAQAILDTGKQLGQVADRTWSASELDSELVDLRARLTSRQGVLERYLAILATTKPESIVAVEREITRTVAEIEQIQGRIRYLEHRGAYAQLTFSFEFRDRAAPTRDGSSSFAWLNTMNLSDLREAFRAGWFRDGAPGVDVSTPAGFAPGKKASRPVAVSPDDVVFRVRTARNKPKADLDFWKEALRTRMKEAGYRLTSESEVRAGDTPGALLEVAAPDGASDAAYLIVIFVDGSRLVIVEAAGEAGRFAPRRQAILDAVSAMRI